MADEKIEKGIIEFVSSNFPDFLNNYDIILTPKQAPDVNSSNIANLVQAIYLVFLHNKFDSCTSLYILVSNFAEAFGEISEINFLDKIWEGKEIHGIPIPNLEAILVRDMSQPSFKVSQKYSDILGSKTGSVYTLGELNILLQFAKKRIFATFLKIYLKHDVKVPVQFPNFSEKKEQSAMEPL